MEKIDKTIECNNECITTGTITAFNFELKCNRLIELDNLLCEIYRNGFDSNILQKSMLFSFITQDKKDKICNDIIDCIKKEIEDIMDYLVEYQRLMLEKDININKFNFNLVILFDLTKLDFLFDKINKVIDIVKKLR